MASKWRREIYGVEPIFEPKGPAKEPKRNRKSLKPAVRTSWPAACIILIAMHGGTEEVVTKPKRLLLELLLSNESLADQREFLDAVLEVADILVIVLDRKGRIVRFNRACEEATGYSAEEVQGKVSWDALIPPEQVPRVRAVFDQLLDGAERSRFRNDWLTRDGGRVQIEWSNTILRGVDGSVRYIVGTGLDLTTLQRAERRLRRSESREAAIINAAVEGILVVDEDRRIELANPSLHAMFGYEDGELAGRGFECLIPERFRSRHQDYHRAFFERPMSRIMPSSLGIRGRRKDGSEFPIRISLGYCEGPECAAVVAMIADQTEAERQRLELQDSHDRVRRLAANLLVAETNEDRRIARDLHDGLVQDLAALSIEVGLLARRAPESRDELLAELRRIEAEAKAIATNARDWSHSLHPAAVENLGLRRSVQSLCASIGRQYDVPVRFAARGDPPELPLQTAMAVYRIAQEAIRNAIRHSGAQRVDVRIGSSSDAVELEVEDAGLGFDVRAQRRGEGLGMTTMQERARLIGGALEVLTKPGDGTLVRLTAPAKES